MGLVDGIKEQIDKRERKIERLKLEIGDLRNELKSDYGVEY